MTNLRILSVVLMILSFPAIDRVGADESLRREASLALRRAADFYATRVASHGGYLYRYSEDLSKREGEGKASVDTVWVQPPGTPSVGMAFLEAYQKTHQEYLKVAAVRAADCLIQGQLRSGGWTQQIDFAPDDRRKYAFRVDPVHKRPGRNWTTFDDDKSQSAMRFLMSLDRELKFSKEELHEASLFALNSVVKAQFPNGAWPQGYESFPVDTDRYPVKRASFPETWPRKYPGGNYWIFYTFNDNAIADTIETLFLASDVYGDTKYRDAAVRAGEFILLAQLPDPQPAWAQQYDFEMHPVWARKFEPPAITGGESQGVMRVLLRLYEETGERRFLEPIPKAIEYLRRSLLPDGGLARFYELKTNKPLYFTKEYELTHDDHDLPTHYGFKIASRLDQIETSYRELLEMSSQDLARRREQRRQPRRDVPAAPLVKKLIQQLDDRGAWVEDGRLRYYGPNDPTTRIIDNETFIRNIGILSRYVGNKNR